eukprot:GHVU01039621.1.p1 GENE.GHVU01039621.1~~GHVU01039621.1.p1  ORF type:complete len:108 (-),score=6.17 GHVU01039621.1:179-502(-)
MSVGHRWVARKEVAAVNKAARDDRPRDGRPTVAWMDDDGWCTRHHPHHAPEGLRGSVCACVLLSCPNCNSFAVRGGVMDAPPPRPCELTPPTNAPATGGQTNVYMYI